MFFRALSGGGGGEMTIDDITAASRTFNIKTGMVIQYVKATKAVRAVAVIENGSQIIASNQSFGAVTCTYNSSTNVLTIGDTIYATQPSAIAYCITE